MRSSRRAMIALVALLSISTAGCAHTARAVEGNPDLRREIEAVNRRFMEFAEQRNAAGVASLYTDDAQLLPPNMEPVVGRQAIQSFMQNGGKVDLRTVEVGGMGDTAYERGAYTFYTPAGQPFDNGNYIVIWKKSDGGWKIHRDIWSSQRPARRQ